MPRCAWGLCNSDSRYGERSKNPKQSMVGVKFFAFPKPKTKLDRCMAWIKACGRKDFTVKHVNYNTYVCSKHFVNGSPSTTYPDPFPALENISSQHVQSKQNRSSSRRYKFKELLEGSSSTSLINTSTIIPQDRSLQSDMTSTMQSTKKAMKINSNLKRKKLKLKCFSCGYASHYTYHMSNHILNVHLRLKTYKCDECDIVAASKQLLAKHKHQSHSHERKPVYRICKCGFRSRSFEVFQRHFRFNHMPNYPWTCSYCSFVSSKQQQLTNHIAEAHPPKLSALCGLCGFKAEKQETIKLHIIRKHLTSRNLKKGEAVPG